MNMKEVETLRGQAGCAALLERQGCALDCKQSIRRAVKFVGTTSSSSLFTMISASLTSVTMPTAGGFGVGSV
ncbi:hypothetical protein LAV81_22415, partial [Rhizobium sp. VS19-DR183]|nr:hypothetical protein [Rhizobium sp. VS19-DR183]